MEAADGKISYVGLLMPETSVRRGDCANAMVMLKNMSLESVKYPVRLFITAGSCKDWRLCSSKEYVFSPGEHLHAYLSIPGEYLSDAGTDEFLVFAGNTPPESEAQMRGVSDILFIED